MTAKTDDDLPPEAFDLEDEDDSEYSTTVEEFTLNDALCKTFYQGECVAYYENARTGPRVSHMRALVSVCILHKDKVTGAATEVDMDVRRSKTGAMEIIASKPAERRQLDDLKNWTAIVGNHIAYEPDNPDLSRKTKAEFEAYTHAHGTSPGQMAVKIAWDYVEKHADDLLAAIERRDMKGMFGNAIIGFGGCVANGPRNVYDLDRMAATRAGKAIVAAALKTASFSVDPDIAIFSFVETHFPKSNPLVVRLNRKSKESTS